MNRSDLVLGVLSFCVPGLGQFLSARFIPAAIFFLVALLAWIGPGMLASYHFGVLGENDPVSQAEFYSSLAPFSILARLIVHSAAAYDAVAPVVTRGMRSSRARLRRRQGGARRSR